MSRVIEAFGRTHESQVWRSFSPDTMITPTGSDEIFQPALSLPSLFQVKGNQTFYKFEAPHRVLLNDVKLVKQMLLEVDEGMGH